MEFSMTANPRVLYIGLSMLTMFLPAKSIEWRSIQSRIVFSLCRS